MPDAVNQLAFQLFDVDKKGSISFGECTCYEVVRVCVLIRVCVCVHVSMSLSAEQGRCH